MISVLFIILFISDEYFVLEIYMRFLVLILLTLMGKEEMEPSNKYNNITAINPTGYSH